MFTVILAVAALADYVIIIYCILNMVTKPTVKKVEIQKDVSEECVMVHINNDKEFNAYIKEQNYRIALLSLNVEEILSNIDAIIERNKVKQGVMLG